MFEVTFARKIEQVFLKCIRISKAHLFVMCVHINCHACSKGHGENVTCKPGRNENQQSRYITATFFNCCHYELLQNRVMVCLIYMNTAWMLSTRITLACARNKLM